MSITGRQAAGERLALAFWRGAADGKRMWFGRALALAAVCCAALGANVGPAGNESLRNEVRRDRTVA